ncbi:ATP-binding protein [Sulfolobus tengchongensis]|uniref:ATP-binding protein n=1 Tax=Sulfolobus tengchongensis TaxID=207809 RepID=A0AAX4L3E1_9CREN
MTSDFSLYNDIKDKISKARALAITLGDLVGKVSRYLPSKVDEENDIVNVVVDPNTYYKYPFLGKIGIFLGAVDIKSLYFVLLRVIGYERSDASSLFMGDSSILSNVGLSDDEPGSLITNVTLKCEMLTKVDFLSSSDPEAADITLEPQSPVIIPKPEVIERSLGTTRGLLRLGFLDVSYSRVRVSTSLDDLNFHMLILGTTGAGKTSFIKDLIAGLNVVNEEGSKTFILDATGDYYHIFLPPDKSDKIVRNGVEEFNQLYGAIVKGINLDIIYPVSRTWVKKYLGNSKSAGSIAKVYFDMFVKPIVNYLNSKGVTLYSSIINNKIIISNSEWSSQVTIYPFYFRFRDVKGVLHRLNPYFSEQASHFIKIMIRKKGKEISKLDDLITEFNDNGLEGVEIHRSTKENIIRGLYLLKETQLFDVGVERFPLSKVLKNSSSTIVFDLYNSELDDFSQKILTYYFLDRLFEFREKQMRGGSVKGRYVIVIDEAHRFFPSSKGGEEDTNYIRKVAGKIATMMRLGRRRKIGFIFATHNPNDLSDIIIQLANTKVLFRIKSEVAEALGLSKTEARILNWEKNGVSYLLTPWLREGKIKIKVPVPPPLGHYDLSKT